MSLDTGTRNRHTSTVALSRRIINDYLKSQWPLIVTAVFFMIVVAGATAAQALLIEPALDELVVKGNVALLWLIPGGFFCAAVIKGFSNYFQTVFMQKVGLRMIVMMQDQMFVHIIRADLAHIQCEATGK
ncbi:MAG: hypothetical protein CMP14_10065 [Rickettsiales bacterium]|nr:hypothetical protein [Rickettsiales bacterium]